MDSFTEPSILLSIATILLWISNDVQAQNQKTCGFPPQYYIPSSQGCKNGKVIELTTLPTDLPSTTTTQELTSCSHNDDILYCDSQAYCGAREGFKCCGFDRYRPDFETCCQQTSAKYKIHTNKPEKEYVCCGYETFKRGSKDVPCNHPSLNDRFFQKPPNLKKKNPGQDICMENYFAYKIDIIGHNRSTESLEARITMLRWNTTVRRVGKPLAEDQMTLPLDRYSPRSKHYVGRNLLVFSTYPHHKDIVFFLKPQDKVYKSPRNRKQLKKLLRKIKRRCYKTMKKANN